MKKSILLVDDAPFMRMMQRDILCREGYAIAGEANDGPEACELYKSLAPDLVLLDIVMPYMDGLYALRQIKAADGGARVVMCSARGQVGTVTEALMAGARHFVVKAFQAETLLNAIRGAFGQEKRFNQDVLKRIHDAGIDSMRMLTQSEIDCILRLALDGGVSDSDVQAFIEEVKRSAPWIESSATS